MSEQPPFAEYPRPGGGTTSYSGRGPGVYFEAIGESWNVIRQDLGTWIAATIVTFVVSYAVLLPFGPLLAGVASSMQHARDLTALLPIIGVEILASFVFFVAYSMLLTGMIGLGVRKLRGEFVNVGMIFEPFRHFGRMIGVIALNFVIVAAAYVACFLPALYFFPVLMLMPSVGFLRGLGAVESLSLTFDACKRFGLGLLALHIVLSLIMTVASFFCLLPILLAFPVFCVTMAIHYRAFFESEPVAAAYG